MKDNLIEEILHKIGIGKATKKETEQLTLVYGLPTKIMRQRKKLRMSRRELANKIGTLESVIRGLEEARIIPEKDAVLDLEKALGIPLYTEHKHVIQKMKKHHAKVQKKILTTKYMDKLETKFFPKIREKYKEKARRANTRTKTEPTKKTEKKKTPARKGTAKRAKPKSLAVKKTTRKKRVPHAPAPKQNADIQKKLIKGIHDTLDMLAERNAATSLKNVASALDVTQQEVIEEIGNVITQDDFKMPKGTSILIEGPIESQKETFTQEIIQHHLAQTQKVAYISYDPETDTAGLENTTYLTTGLAGKLNETNIKLTDLLQDNPELMVIDVINRFLSGEERDEAVRFISANIDKMKRKNTTSIFLLHSSIVDSRQLASIETLFDAVITFETKQNTRGEVESYYKIKRFKGLNIKPQLKKYKPRILQKQTEQKMQETPHENIVTPPKPIQKAREKAPPLEIPIQSYTSGGIPKDIPNGLQSVDDQVREIRQEIREEKLVGNIDKLLSVLSQKSEINLSKSTEQEIVEEIGNLITQDDFKMPKGTSILIEGPIESQKETFTQEIIQHHLAQTQKVAYISYDPQTETYNIKDNGLVLAPAGEINETNLTISEQVSEDPVLLVANVLNVLLPKYNIEEITKFTSYNLSKLKKSAITSIFTLDDEITSVGEKSALETLFDAIISFETKQNARGEVESYYKIKRYKGLNTKPQLKKYKPQTHMAKTKKDAEKPLEAPLVVEGLAPESASISPTLMMKLPAKIRKEPEEKKQYPQEVETIKITTGLDQLYQVIRDKKTIRIDAAAKALQVDEGTIETWANILEKQNLVKIRYPSFGKTIISVIR